MEQFCQGVMPLADTLCTGCREPGALLKRVVGRSATVVYRSVNACLSLYGSPVMNWQFVQGLSQAFALMTSGITTHNPECRISGDRKYMDGRMDGWMVQCNLVIRANCLHLVFC